MNGELPSLKVLIVASETIVRIGLANMLTDPDAIYSIEEAIDRTSLDAHLVEHDVDVVVVYLGQGLDLTALAAAQLVKSRRLHSRLILLATNQESTSVAASIVAGVDAYLPRDIERGALLATVQDIMHYGLVLGKDGAAVVRKHLAVIDAAETSALLLATLTEREYEVLAQLTQNRSNEDIAQTLSISSDTVRAHLKSIYRKLKIASRASLVDFSQHAGITQTPCDQGVVDGNI
ncbi:MAG: response regulator transcription factor [Ktedonobacteraceae bacterium]|nr:response regulator transcription factor [Ktedonobacteraceae bacterium]MBA3946751.1 response regulator transcription factor [Herpetosiphonaceae bacterium]